MSKHTKGPWKTGREDMQSYSGVSGEPFTNIYHAEITDGQHLGQKLPLTIGRAEGKNNKANARLMAAAPELLKACSVMLAVMNSYGNWDEGCFYYNRTAATELQEPLGQLEAAIKKATEPQ